MRIGLVSTYTHPYALGLRYLSSALKAAGHEVVLVFMSSKRDTTEADYSGALLGAFVQRLEGCAVVGLSLMTNNYHRACALTQRLRAAGTTAPIVWGGTHATVAPEECLEHADAVCVGEGEDAMRLLAERWEGAGDPTDIPGLWFRREGAFGNTRVIRNQPKSLQTQLDTLPFPDYDLERQWVVHNGELVRATPENLRGALNTLRVITARGCPFHCTFCNNAALQEIHAGLGRWVRTRSLDNVLDEIRGMLGRFACIEAVNFVDDLFFVRSAEEIEGFADKYNADVGLPLQLDAFPNTVTERKVAALARVPIQLISMGVESASADTLKSIYQRPTPPKRIAEAIEVFARHRVRTEYHYIVSNPFEPEENVIETMRFVASHHRGRAVIRVFPLMFYPRTPLYERARAEGLIGTQDRAAYDHMGTGALQFAKHDYLAVWLRVVLGLRNVAVPRWVCHRVIDFATSRAVRRVLDRRWFCPTVFVTYQVGRKVVRNFIHQPLVKPWKYLWRRVRRGRDGGARQRVVQMATGPATLAAPGEPGWEVVPGRRTPAARRGEVVETQEVGESRGD